MSLYTKSVVAIFFLGFGLIAVICMLTLMARAERKISATLLRRLHKGAGAVFTIMYLVIGYFCLHYVKMLGEGMSARAVFHGVLALALFVVLAFKLSIVQFYKQFLRYVPGLGMTVFSLAFAVFFTSAGYFFLVRGGARQAEKPVSEAEATADAGSGQTLFDNQCSFCHYADRAESKLGPGLKGVLKADKLPVSGRPATPENVTQQLLNPYKSMPSFASLSEQQIKDLLAYLRTL
ncbi:MAG: c-type cytochrome [candidate division Zixibacteria bacterium]|nr:c-type cytochrome [candidate division Zixibacteria bacterium]